MPVIEDRAYWLKKAERAEENVRWNLDRAQRAARENNDAAYRSHMADAKSYKRDADNFRYLASKCKK